MKPLVPFKWRGNHHSYFGAFFIAFGIFNWFMGVDNGELSTLIPLWQACIGIGTLMLVDDIIEHTLTADTPLRIIYVKIIKPMLIKNSEK